MRLRFLTPAIVAFAFTACGDSTAPNLALNDEQVADMMDAMSTAGLSGFTPPPVGSSLAVITVNETVDCPNGGTTTISATIDDGGTSTSVSMSLTQSFTNCKATSSSGRMWTFNGNPNIVTTFTGTSNETTGAFSLSGSQTGGVIASSNLGSGSCAWDVDYSMTGNDLTGAFSSTVTGTVCGRNISQTITGQ